ncbi:restriction endonuclease subunit S [Myroides indicus]|uniref:Type I restriction enzyme S subunit n=1 Tax=Myroides indicus TaxID=1323422 RepID=A0A4R7EYS9_9FLAO|nr:restriction endonuclease subunit S [Myroides indicus]TDS59628.1 type I restriction enzyme S subunit [Myroides indicus]
MSYKRLGDYIIEKVEFNEGNKYDLLQGVSNNKYFQKAKTNTIGVDLSKYRVAHYNQFVFNRATTRNGDKISIALRKGESCIVSPSYRIFEVKDENVLNPDYLLMWFKRPEFDRYARFKSHGSAHEFFDMEEMCDVELPVPTLEKQKEIVTQYQAVSNKIKINEQICEKLEATAQALYKHWFVDFEFPNENGQAYKSSGGKMVYNQELEKEIPEGWEVGLLSDLITVKYGKDYKHLSKGDIPLYGSGGIMGYVNEVLYNKPSVLIPRKGSLNNILYVKTPFWSVDTMFYTIPKIDNTLIYVFNVLSKMDFNSLNVGSAVPSMTTEYLNSMQILIPENNVLEAFDFELNQLEDYKITINNQNQKLTQLQSLLLSRLARLEG